MFGHFQRNTQILHLIRLEFGWEESDKSRVIGRIVPNQSAFRKRKLDRRRDDLCMGGLRNCAWIVQRVCCRPKPGPIGQRSHFGALVRFNAAAFHIPFCKTKVSVNTILGSTGSPLKVPSCAAMPVTIAASP